jgi:hypothetical protein
LVAKLTSSGTPACARQIQLPVDEGRPYLGGVAEKHPNLAILLLAGGASVLAGHPNRPLTLFQKSCLVNDEHATRLLSKMLYNIVSKILADGVHVPVGTTK